MTDLNDPREGCDGDAAALRHTVPRDVPDAVVDLHARTSSVVAQKPERRRRRSAAARAPRPKGLRGERGRAKRLKLAARDGARCFYCHVPFPDPTLATLDHYIPTSLWKCHSSRNLVLACLPCNNRKADRLPWPLVWLLLATAGPAVAA